MMPPNRKKKFLVFLALAALGLLLAPFVAVQIQERIFRHRAEQLLADMRTLMLHKANLAEIQTAFKRWNPSEVGCYEDDCWFQSDISYGPFLHFLDYGFVPDIAVFWRSNQSKFWLRPFRMYGGRLAHARAYARVINGVVRGILFPVDVETSAPPDDWRNSKQVWPQNILSAQAVSVRRFSLQNDWRGLTLHPNYVIDVGSLPRGHVRPPDVYAAFGPHADPADVSRLASFDLSCVTRWVACRTPEDIMPEAAVQFAREAPQLAQARKDRVCGTDIVALMARDAGRAGVVEMTGSRIKPHLSDVPIPAVRLIQDFESAGDWKIGETRELRILEPSTDRAVTVLPPEVHNGNRFIMLAESELGFRRWVETYDCGTVPLNPANLELVRQAIAGNLPPVKP